MVGFCHGMWVVKSPQQTARSNTMLHDRAGGRRWKRITARNVSSRKIVRDSALAAVAGQEVFSTGQKRATHRMTPTKASITAPTKMSAPQRRLSPGGALW